MKRMGKLAVGSLVGVALTFGLAGTATAAPASITTTGATATTTPAAPAPSTSAPATSAPAKPKSLTGSQIWEVVNVNHKIDCARASKELKRIGAADASATKRLTRWQKRSAAAQMSTRKHAKRQTRYAARRVRSLQTLQKDGAALIKRIDAKCAVRTPAS